MEKTNEKYQGRGARDRHLSAAVELAWDKCTEYYRKLDDTPIYLAGVILHPSHKWQRFETLWGGTKKTRKWIQEGKAKIKAFWESEYKSLEEPENTPKEQSTRSEFEMFLEGRTPKDLTPGDEYDRWCRLEPFQHDNALSYWIDNRSRWPKLSRMAIDVFSVPAMSAEPKRVFSITGAMCSPRRSRLKAE
jgi:hAT family C-terminal dimerisation region